MALPAPLLQLKTYDDLQSLPDDGNRYELIFGEIVMSPSPRARHQQTIADLAFAMREFARAHRLGDVYFAPFDVRFSNLSVVQPDIFFLSVSHIRRLTQLYVDGAPDLVVEVLSPSNRAVDLIKKAALYLNYAVPEYWVVDPESETITVNVLVDGQYIARDNTDGQATSLVLQGFSVNPETIFSEPEWLRSADSETE
jgi:Uma2 family endonuclease